MVKAPNINRITSGRTRFKHRTCPYADCDVTGRIPDTERAPHPVTSGYMALDIRAGHGATGWVCEDPNCPFFLGTATTPISIPVRRTSVDRVTGKYTVTTEGYETPLCSGYQFWET